MRLLALVAAPAFLTGCLSGGLAQRGDEAMARGDWAEAMADFEEAKDDAKRNAAAEHWLEAQLPRAQTAADAGRLDEGYGIALSLAEQADRMKLEGAHKQAIDVLDRIVMKMLPHVESDEARAFPKAVARSEQLTIDLPAGTRAGAAAAELKKRAAAAHRKLLGAAPGDRPGVAYFHARMMSRYGSPPGELGTIERQVRPAWAIRSTTDCPAFESAVISSFSSGAGLPVTVGISGSCTPHEERWDTSEVKTWTEKVESWELVNKNVCENRSEYVNTTCHTEHYSKDMVKEVCVDNRVDHEVCHNEASQQKVIKDVEHSETVPIHHVKYTLSASGSVRMAWEGVAVEKSVSSSPSLEDSAWDSHAGSQTFTKKSSSLLTVAGEALKNDMDSARQAFGSAAAKVLAKRGEDAEQAGDAAAAESNYVTAVAVSGDVSLAAARWFSTKYDLDEKEARNDLYFGAAANTVRMENVFKVEFPKVKAETADEEKVITRVSDSKSGDGFFFANAAAMANGSPGGATRGTFTAGLRLDVGKELKDEDIIGPAVAIAGEAGADTKGDIAWDITVGIGPEVRIWLLGFAPMVMAGTDLFGGRDDGGLYAPAAILAGVGGEVNLWPYARWDAHLSWQHPWRFLHKELVDFIDQEDRFEVRWDLRAAPKDDVNTHFGAGLRFADYDGRGQSFGAFVGYSFF